MLALGWTLVAFLYFAGIVHFVVQDIRDLARDPMPIPWHWQWGYLAWPIAAFSDALESRKKIMRVLRR